MKPTATAKWNNESEPTQVWLNLPEGWGTQSQLLVGKQPKSAESHEERLFEIELSSPDTSTETTKITGYALYYICESEAGQCLYRRQDFEFEVQFESK